MLLALLLVPFAAFAQGEKCVQSSDCAVEEVCSSRYEGIIPGICIAPSPILELQAEQAHYRTTLWRSSAGDVRTIRGAIRREEGTVFWEHERGRNIRTRHVAQHLLRQRVRDREGWWWYR